jgi:uncharacterized protein (TIGR03435 family)
MHASLENRIILYKFRGARGLLTNVAGVLAVATLVIPGQVLAQSAKPALNFEVATVKEAADGPNGVSGGCHGNNSVYSPSQQAGAPSLGRCVITDARLSHLIGIAYSVSMLNLKTGPDWIQRGNLRFNVVAKAEDPTQTTEQQLLTMLQNLLAERFQLKFHYEASEVAGFALTVAKNGPKLKVSRSDETTLFFAGPKGETLLKPYRGAPVAITARKYSISALINVLSQLGSGLGVDKTGLTGEYDFTLSWDEKTGPDLSTALREQLGLRIEFAKVPTTIFVVDSAQKPLPN